MASTTSKVSCRCYSLPRAPRSLWLCLREVHSAHQGNCPVAANEGGVISVDVGMLAGSKVPDHALRGLGPLVDVVLHCRLQLALQATQQSDGVLMGSCRAVAVQNETTGGHTLGGLMGACSSHHMQSWAASSINQACTSLMAFSAGLRPTPWHLST